jgi:hypothetical protein
MIFTLLIICCSCTKHLAAYFNHGTARDAKATLWELNLTHHPQLLAGAPGSAD